MASLCGLPVRPRDPRALHAAVHALGSNRLLLRLKAEECLYADRRRAAPLLRQAAGVSLPETRAVRAAILLHRIQEKEGAEMLRRLAREHHLRTGEASDLLRRAVREIIGPDYYLRQASAALIHLEQMPESQAAIGRFRQTLEILRFLRVSPPTDLLRRALVVRTVGGENLSLVRTVLDGTRDSCLEHVSMARTAAVETILHLDDRQKAYALLARTLAHPNPAVELTAMHGLGQLRDPRAIGPLLRIARDVRSPVCEDARRILALLSTGAPDVLTLLRPATPTDILPEELLRPAVCGAENAPETLVRPFE
jgi:hypothetical protein